MNSEEVQVIVAAANGKPSRLVVAKSGSLEHRDTIDPNSHHGRNRFVKGFARKAEAHPESVEWLHDRIVNAADAADVAAQQIAGSLAESAPSKSASTTTQIIELVDDVEFFKDGRDVAYAWFSVGGHHEVTKVRKKTFRNFLSKRFYMAHGRIPASASIQEAADHLEGKAMFEGETRNAFVRIAGHDGKVYIDLCDSRWRVIEVDRDGWRLLDRSPIPFIRTPAMKPLPDPTSGGSLDELSKFINVPDVGFRLVKGWLHGAFNPTGAYPILVITGEPGSAKTTTSRIIRSVIDPNEAPLRSESKEPRDLMIAASNAHVFALDNLSAISARMSDCYCQISTGGGYSTRSLYQDDEEQIFNVRRPLLFNGIDSFASASDLLDRAIVLELPTISEANRQMETKVLAAFEVAAPRILGALLDAVSTSLRNSGSFTLDRQSRMADFEHWVEAAAPALGMERGEFLEAYDGNRKAGDRLAIEGSMVGALICNLVQDRGYWEGTARDLLTELEQAAPDRVKKNKHWPGTAQRLGGEVKRIARNLRNIGIPVEYDRVGKARNRMIALGGRTTADNLGPKSCPPLTDELPTSYGDKNAGGRGGQLFPDVVRTGVSTEIEDWDTV